MLERIKKGYSSSTEYVEIFKNLESRMHDQSLRSYNSKSGLVFKGRILEMEGKSRKSLQFRVGIGIFVLSHPRETYHHIMRKKRVLSAD